MAVTVTVTVTVTVRERESEREREVVWRAPVAPHLFKATPVFALFVLSLVAQPWSAMVTAFLGGIQVRGDKNTMSATMKPAKEFHEFDVGQPTAVCHLMVVPSRRQLVSLFRPAQGGADTSGKFVEILCLFWAA